MGTDIIDTNTNFSGKYDLDGTKIFDTTTGETVFDLEELPLELLEELYIGLVKEKRAAPTAQKINIFKDTK